MIGVCKPDFRSSILCFLLISLFHLFNIIEKRFIFSLLVVFFYFFVVEQKLIIVMRWTGMRIITSFFYRILDLMVNRK